MSAGENLARYAAATDWLALPAAVRTRCVDHVVDTVGLMLAGVNVEACVQARSAAGAWGHSNACAVAGLDGRYPASSAAFLNALQGRIHAFDDTYEPGNLHPGNPVVAAALALSEEQGADGRTFFSAVAAGYEVATRVAAAVSPSHYDAGFHSSGTCAVFGAAAAGARVLGLDATSMAEALGLAGAAATGLRQHQIDGSMSDSALHGARAAQSGVMAAQLRAAGVKGPAGILDGALGFCAVMAPARDVTRLDAELGTRFEFLETTIKPYPTAFFVHGPIDAALELKRAHAIDPRRIAAVEIATFRQSFEVSNRPLVRTRYDAILSHQYGVAVALTRDHVALTSFTEEALTDPAVQQLAAKIRVLADPVLDDAAKDTCPHRITIVLDDGRVLQSVSVNSRGRNAAVAAATVDAKFLGNATLALDRQQARDVLSTLRALPDSPGIRELTRLLVPSRTSTR